MGQMFINLIFNLLNALATLLLSPIFAIASLIIPDFTTYVGSINIWLGYGLTYFNFFVDLFMIPRAPLIAVCTLALGIISFNVTLRVVGLSVAVYKYFKP